MIGGPLESILLEIDGAATSGWFDVDLSESAEEAVRTAMFQFAMPPLNQINGFVPRPDKSAKIYISGELWLTGFIGDITPDHGEDGGGIGVEVLSKTIDTVESSVVHKTGHIKNADLLAIAKEFESAGVEWVSKADLKPEGWHDVNLGESNFETVERVARSRQKLIYDNPQGQAVIADKPEGRHSGALALGVNIKSASSTLSNRDRHTPVIARGQSSLGHGAAALRSEASVDDDEIGRIRPKIVLLEGEATNDKLQDRASWQLRRAAGESRTCQITVPGMRDEGGQLWKRNWLVSVDNPLIFLKQDMVIKSVEFSQHTSGGNPEGSFTKLNLADPRALGGKPSKGSSDAVWSVSDPAPKVRVQ